jgi:thiamine biosynthesis lipoprotein
MKKITSILFSGILLGSILSCATKNPVYDSFSGFTQGTTYSIIFQNDGNLNLLKVRTGVEDLLRLFDMSLSLYQDSSVISKINRNEDVEIDSFFSEAFRKARKLQN